MAGEVFHIERRDLHRLPVRRVEQSSRWQEEPSCSYQGRPVQRMRSPTASLPGLAIAGMPASENATRCRAVSTEAAVYFAMKASTALTKLSIPFPISSASKLGKGALP